MKKTNKGLAIAIILLSAMLVAPCASTAYGFSRKIGASNGSTSSFAENGAVSLAFDDTMQGQYDYAWPLLKARGLVATFYVVTDQIRDLSHDSSYMSVAELQNLQNSGCEIGSHSKTHSDFIRISDAQIREECNVSKQVLESYGFVVSNLAYPYGDTNSHVDSIVSQYYRSGRSAYVRPYLMQLPTSRFSLSGYPGDSVDPSDLRSMIDQVYNTKGWAIIFFHDIPTHGTYPISTNDFAEFLDYILAKGITALTVSQALNMGSRDVGITSVVPSAVQAVAGTIININVTTRNEGAMTETFNVTTYYDSNKIETQTVTDLTPGATRTLTFHWNTSLVPFGTHTIKAEASTVPDETDKVDNVYVDGTVEIFGPPIASFSIYPSNPHINKSVLFNASSSTPNGGIITNYIWDFGDDNITSTASAIASHTYISARTYNVSLTVTNIEGLEGSASKLVTADIVVQGIFSVASNSTVTDLSFNSTSLELSFIVVGPSGTTGLTRVTIVKTLAADVTNLKVFLDEKPLQYSTTETEDSWVVSFAYTHSTHHVMLALNPSRLRGDVNNDGRVDMRDVGIVAAAFGARPADTRWNSAADLDNNGIINMADIAIVACALFTYV